MHGWDVGERMVVAVKDDDEEEYLRTKIVKLKSLVEKKGTGYEA